MKLPLLLLTLLLVSCQIETQEDPKKGIVGEVCDKSEGFYFICPSDKENCWYIGCPPLPANPKE